MKQIILASKSPRRRELLEKAGIKFKIAESKFEEYFDPKLNPRELVEKLSLEKAKAVYRKNSRAGGNKAIIIAADTLIVCDGKVLGKPKNEKDAKRMLQFLSGKVHSIITAFTIIDGDLNKIITKSEETKIHMRKINDNEINGYVQTNEPFDKAGAYAVQGIAEKFIEKIEGNFDNAVGLPLNSLMKELKKIGAF